MKSLEKDLERLRKLAFRPPEAAHHVRWIYDNRRSLQRSEYFKRIQDLREWLLTPLALWPIQIDKLAGEVRREIESIGKLSQDLALLLEMLGPAPTPKAEDTLIEHEHLARLGEYQKFLTGAAKYEDLKASITGNPKFKRDWEQICRGHDVNSYREKGRLRRSMIPERNFRGHWQLDWGTKQQKFRACFDAFCWKWNLYGMDGDEPWPMLPTVNVTSHGTMIFIPRYWSFSSKRDLRWKAVHDLHKTFGSRRQGARMSSNRREAKVRNHKAVELDQAAKASGLVGEDRFDHIRKGLGLDPRTDRRQIQRMISQGRLAAQ